MMFIPNWLGTRETDVFVKLVVSDLAGRIPPPTESTRKRISPERVRNAHDAICARVAAFARTRKPNWFKKAYLGYVFRNALRELGYDDEFVDSWTHDLLVEASTSRDSADSAGKQP